MNLLPARFRSQELEPTRDNQIQYSLDDWIAYINELFYNGNAYFTQGANQTQPGQRQEPIGPAYSALTSLAYKSDSVVYACMQTRANHFAQVRFQWRRLKDGQPQDLFGTAELQPLETPWPGGTTQDLLTKMIQHADLGGNAFVVRKGDGLALLRPDWVTIIIGSNTDPQMGAWATDADILGYIYSPGGYNAATSGYETEIYNADEVAHFAPTPDPMARYRGMSWLTPLLREVMADKAATEHKLKFFENPTPNMIVKFDVPDLDEFKAQVAAFKDAHMGAQNAYKWMFTASGVDTQVVGSNMHDLDYKLITGAGETRIAAAARTPPVLVGLSEGLQGSSLNAGNYQAARRHFVDETIRYLWANACASLSNIMAVPGGAELWYDDRYTAFVKEDIGERADVELKKAQTIRFLVDAGYLPESVINAVEAEDLGLLEHSGLFSVQLQPANAPKQGIFTGVPTPITQTGVEPAGQVSAPQPATNGNGNGRHALDELLDALEGLRERPMEIHNHLPDQDPMRGQYEPPPVNVTVEAGEPPHVEFAEGAFRTEIAPPPPAEVNVNVEAAPTPDVSVSMDLEPVADGLRALAEAQSERNIEVTVPERAVTVNVPDAAVPVVNVTNEVQTPEVTVNVPDQPAPVVNVNIEDEPLDASVDFRRNPDGSIKSAKITDNEPTDG